MQVDQLSLAPLMRQAAMEIQLAHPTVDYLSGKRDLSKQAHAMACNLVTDPHFLVRTYKHAAALQQAIERHPGTTVAQIEAVLLETLRAMPPEELCRISDHFQGDAVDLAPMEADGILSDEGKVVCEAIHRHPATTYFTTRESGLARWHWACKPRHAG